ncbi:MAG: ABC transporter permease, partial [Bryobacteraceae bacterium]
MPSLVQDTRLAARIFAKSPGFTAVAVLSIALGIGANTTIFSVVDGVVLRPLSYRDPAGLVVLYEKRVQQNRLRNVVSQPDYVDWKARNTVFEGMAGVTGAGFTLAGDGEPEFLRGAAVAPNFFRMVGIQPQLGRDFADGEDQPGAAPVILLSNGFWKRRFGSDPTVVGRTLTLSGQQRTVVGVLPDVPMSIRSTAEIWQPLILDPKAFRGLHFLQVFARLKPGVSAEKARAEMVTLAANIERENPDVNKGHSINLFHLKDEVVGDVRPALLTLLGAVGLVLMIACANVANLLLARAVQRRRETSIRVALGAAWWQLARQHMIENLLLSFVGGAAGLLIASWTIGLLHGMTAVDIPRLQEIGMDNRVLLFTFGLA